MHYRDKDTYTNQMAPTSIIEGADHLISHRGNGHIIFFLDYQWVKIDLCLHTEIMTFEMSHPQAYALRLLFTCT